MRLAVAALRSSVGAVARPTAVPPGEAGFVEQVDAYAAYYELQPGLGGSAEPPPTSMPVATATPSPTVTRTPATLAPTTPANLVSKTATATPRPPANPPVQFSYGSFVSSTSLRLNGSARVADGKLHLAAASVQAGSAWSTTTIDPTKSFDAAFTAEITKIADGLAFVIQRESATAIGSAGGGLGYGALPGYQSTLVAPSVAVELDTWDNSSDGFDPAGHQHIAVTINGNITQHLAWGDPGFSMYGSGPVHVWINYNAAQHVLAVYASLAATKPASALFSSPINVGSIVGSGRAYVGFTGGTGLTTITDAEESILNWTFATR